MSAWKPQKDKTGGLPNISYIKRKPRPLGTEFKSVVDSATKCMIHLELQRGAEGMAHSKYQSEIGATAACTLRLSETVAVPSDRVVADSWFGSVRACSKLAQRGMFGLMNVKTCHTLFPVKVRESDTASCPS
jgi:Transposase IS4